jgi:hypothetical protein
MSLSGTGSPLKI